MAKVGTVVVGHLQRRMAQERLQGKRIPVAHEVQTRERMEQQMRMQALHIGLPPDPFDEQLERRE
jgi:hypothetical protein